MQSSLEYTKTLHKSTLQLGCRNKEIDDFRSGQVCLQHKKDSDIITDG